LKNEMLHLLSEKRPPTSSRLPPDMSHPPGRHALRLPRSRAASPVTRMREMGWGGAPISLGLSAGCLVARLAEAGGGGATSPDAMSRGWNISKQPLIWIATNNREPNIYKYPSNMDRD
jgi:hypothetical protein